MAEILEPTPENLTAAAQVLQAKGVVGMPTETVYGLAGCAFDEQALARIFEVKERPTFDPLIVHIAPSGARPFQDLEASALIDWSSLSGAARRLVEKLVNAFWPGPLTVVLPKTSRVPDLATSGLPTVAVRMPRHPVAQSLIRAAGFPLAAPSANRFGRISPTSAKNVADDLGDRVSLVLDGGPCDVGVESTVVSIQGDGSFTLLRPGGVSASEIEVTVGAVLSRPSLSSAVPGKASPGMLESHYAPRKPFELLPRRLSQMKDADWAVLNAYDLPAVVGLLVLEGDPEESRARASAALHRNVIARVLSQRGDWKEAARTLFREMRSLDASAAEWILAEPCEEQQGLAHAIGDRLRRAGAAVRARRLGP